MKRFNIALSYPDTNENFAEVMSSVAIGLRAIGREVTENNRFQRGVVNIIFGFYIHPDMPQERSIVYQLEPVDDWTLRNGHVPAHALAQHTVWDYSRHNVQRLREAGCPAFYVPIGCPCVTTSSVSQDIDVLFYGAMHPRRTKIIDDLRRLGLRVESVYGAFGGRLDLLISRAKIVLNMHGSDLHRTFESVRVARILAHHRAVVSEVNIGDDTDGFGGSVLGVPYPSLVDACVFLVKNEERRNEYADAGFAYIHTRVESDIMQQALKESNLF
jgi:hypothetical protein